MRLKYNTPCIGCTQHQYPCCHLKIQRKHSIQTHSTCCFVSETLLTDRFCSHHFVTRGNCIINLSQSPGHFLTRKWAVYNTKTTTKFLFWGTLTFKINLFTYWAAKLCQKIFRFTWALKTIIAWNIINNYCILWKRINRFYTQLMSPTKYNVAV